MQKMIWTILRAIKSFRYIFYLGNTYLCPCCGVSFRRFLTFGEIPRQNAMCPKCGSLERHRLFWLFYKNKTNLFTDNLKLLHFAPERIFQKYLKRLSNIEYASADLSSVQSEYKMDITDIKFQENSFDAILCNDVLEHVDDDTKAISELYRVLKKNGGWAIIQVPVDKSRNTTLDDKSITSKKGRKKYYGRYDHVRLYGLDFVEKLESAGFDVKVVNYISQFQRDEIKKYNLNTDRDIYYCFKN
jgi:predicted SAM-dependent methyltransferase